MEMETGKTALEEDSQLISVINKVLKGKYSHILAMGDFNYPDINW